MEVILVLFVDNKALKKGLFIEHIKSEYSTSNFVFLCMFLYLKHK